MPNPRTHGLVAVGDGRKALLLINTGTVRHPHLETAEVLEADETAPTRDLGTDKPGRAFQSMGHARSAVTQTDWHDLAEQRFAQKVVAAIEALCDGQDLRALTLVAPPRSLANLRQALPERLRSIVIAEIDKDLTKIPVPEIERHLTST